MNGRDINEHLAELGTTINVQREEIKELKEKLEKSLPIKDHYNAIKNITAVSSTFEKKLEIAVDRLESIAGTNEKTALPVLQLEKVVLIARITLKKIKEQK